MPKRIPLTQGDDNWRAWRNKGIGGSDAPVIMWASSFKTPWQLWQEKTGRRQYEEKSGYYVNGEYVPAPAEHGKNLEQAAREAYALETGNFAPPACFEDEVRPWRRVSLDGLIASNHIVEIKCPFDLRTHLMAREGQLPDEYWPQIQHALDVACMDVPSPAICDYYSYFDGEGVLIRVPWDEAYCMNELRPAEEEFWGWVQADKYPLPEGKLDMTSDPVLTEAVVAWADARRMREEAMAYEQRYYRQVMRMAAATGKKQIIADGAKIQWVMRRGWVKYAEVPEVRALSDGYLEGFRGPSNLIFEVRRTLKKGGGQK